MRPRNSTEKLWLGAAAVAALGIVLIGWFFLIAPQRSQTAELDSQASDAQLQNVSLQQRIVELGSQKAHWAAFVAQLRQARQALPTTSAMAPFLRSVQAIGAASSARVTSLTVGTATAVTSTAATAPAAASPSAASGAPAATSPGLYSIQISASVVGSQSALSTFLTRLQSSQPRAVLVTDVIRGRATGKGATTLQLTMRAFVAPPATAAVATPAPVK